MSLSQSNFIRYRYTACREHIVHRAILLDRQLGGFLGLRLINRPCQTENDVYARENIRNLLASLSAHVDLQIVNLLPLLFENADQVQCATRTQCHEHQFHGAYSEPLPTNFGRAIDMYPNICSLANSLKMDGIIGAFERDIHKKSRWDPPTGEPMLYYLHKDTELATKFKRSIKG